MAATAGPFRRRAHPETRKRNNRGVRVVSFGVVESDRLSVFSDPSARGHHYRRRRSPLSPPFNAIRSVVLLSSCVLCNQPNLVRIYARPRRGKNEPHGRAQNYVSGVASDNDDDDDDDRETICGAEDE